MNIPANESRIPFEFAREHLLLPLDPPAHENSPTAIRCLSSGTHTDAALDNLSLFLDAPIDLVPTSEPELRDAITRTYQDQMARSDALRQPSPTTPPNAPNPDRLTVQEALHSLTDRDLLASGDKAPVAKLVDALLFDALTKQANVLLSELGMPSHIKHPFIEATPLLQPDHMEQRRWPTARARWPSSPWPPSHPHSRPKNRDPLQFL